jgi:hypothetical protein
MVVEYLLLVFLRHVLQLSLGHFEIVCTLVVSKIAAKFLATLQIIGKA